MLTPQNVCLKYTKDACLPWTNMNWSSWRKSSFEHALAPLQRKKDGKKYKLIKFNIYSIVLALKINAQSTSIWLSFAIYISKDKFNDWWRLCIIEVGGDAAVLL